MEHGEGKVPVTEAPANVEAGHEGISVLIRVLMRTNRCHLLALKHLFEENHATQTGLVMNAFIHPD